MATEPRNFIIRDNHNIIVGVVKLLGRSGLGAGFEVSMVMVLICSGATGPATLVKAFVCGNKVLPNPKGAGN